jgi:hypothetical protein
MLSAISTLASRTFIIGFFLPTVLGVSTAMFLLGDPAQVVDLLKDAKDQTASLLLLVGCIWLLSILLTIINQVIYRCLEGYYPPLSWRTRTKDRFGEYIEKLRAEARALDAKIDTGDPQSEDARRHDRILLEIASMPPAADKMLPTRFGNAIRAFELYPNEVYGADGVSLWLHAASVAPSPLLETVADARAVVDFMVNCALFSLSIALALIAQASYQLQYRPIVAALRANDSKEFINLIHWSSLGLSLAAMVSAYLFYLAAVALIPAWGQAVKACFDIGLPELAKKLGFELPSTESERQKFWLEFSQTVAYRTRLDRSTIMLAENWLPAKSTPSRGIFLRIWKWLGGDLKSEE